MKMNDCPIIMAILQQNRSQTAIKVQDVLTKYGCHIKVRLGLHESEVGTCSNQGMILLQLDSTVPLQELEQDLKAAGEDVKVKHMTLDF